MLFSNIPGHSSLKNVLEASIESDHFAHAQLFTGGEGSANLAFALAYAIHANSPKTSDGEIDLDVGVTRQLLKLTHPDLHFVFPTATNKANTKRSDALSNNYIKEWRDFALSNPYGNLYDWSVFFGAEDKQCMIPKEESKHIIKTLSIKPFQLPFKTLIIWLPEYMQAAAANAILKILEEPSPQTLFLLVTNNIDQLLPTIVSRTQIVSVPPFQEDDVVSYLKSIGTEENEAAQVASVSNGSLRVAVNLLGKTENNHSVFFQKWMRMCYADDFTSLVFITDDYHKFGKEEQKTFLLYAISTLRNVMLFKSLGDKSIIPNLKDDAFIKNFSSTLSIDSIISSIGEIEKTLAYISRNANPKICFLNLSIELSSIMKLSASLV